MAVRSRPIASLGAALSLVATACGGVDSPGDAQAAPTVAEDLAAGRSHRVIVLLAPPAVDEPEPAARRSPSARRSLALARGAALGRAKEGLLRSIATDGLQVVNAYAALPALHVELMTPAALEQLRARAEVAGIFEDEPHEAQLQQSLPLIGQPVAAAAGAAGEGTAVAVLDTGVDWRRPELGACTAPGVPASCRVAYAADFAPNDGALDAHGHGTNVAAIVAAVAPRTKILALDVFNGGYAYSSDILAAIDWAIQHRDDYGIAAMNLSLGSGGATAPCAGDVFAPAIHAAREAGILAAVASGNSAYRDRVSSPACVPDAVSVGAVYDSAMGGLSWSGCSDPAIAADQVTCFSNSASFLTLLAPGALISAGGSTMGGTSQATPHVAGAIAVVRGLFPEETPDETVTRLRVTGRAIVDGRNGVTTPRIDLAAATDGACFLLATPGSLSPSAAGGQASVALTTGAGCEWTASADASWVTVSPASGAGSATLAVTVAANAGAARSATLAVGARRISVSQGVDTSPPSGSLSFGGLTATRTLAVSLSIAASDPSGVASMCVSNGTTCGAWEPYATSRAWTLSSGASGARTVRVWLRDARGNSSATPLSGTIVYDVTPPTGGSLAASGSSRQVALSWGGFSEPLSGLASYVLVAAQGATAPASCSTGTRLYAGGATSFVHAGLVDGTSWSYRACAVDGAGNVSAGVTRSAFSAPEYVAPVGTARLNDGATATRSLAVTLSSTGSDASGIAAMCVTNGTSCTAWEAFSGSRPWTLASGGNGARTVRVWLRDTYGNVSAAPLVASILYDATPPAGGALEATGSAGQVALAWSGFSDAHSGVGGYVVVGAAGAPPASCAAGTRLHAGPATSIVHGGLVDGTTWGYRVCAVDRAANVSAGVTASARPAPEYAAPTGSVLVDGGAPITRMLAVTLAISASDPSGVASMCVSNATTCTIWEPFRTSKEWTLASGSSGARTVRVWLRDAYGNTSVTPVSDGITYDFTPPSGGTFAATPGARQVALTWGGFSDAPSGVASYRLVVAAGKTAPVNCDAGTRLYTGAGASFVHAGLAGGSSWAYRLCAVDGVGNVSSGIARAAVAAP